MTNVSYIIIFNFPDRSEADQLEIDRLMEQNALLNTVLEENGLTIPSNSPEPYKAYSWKDSSLDIDA